MMDHTDMGRSHHRHLSSAQRAHVRVARAPMLVVVEALTTAYASLSWTFETRYVLLGQQERSWVPALTSERRS